MTPNEIIKLARDFKIHWHTNNPYEIAKRLGIQIIHTKSSLKDFTAHTIKVTGYPTIISINDAFTEFSQKVLCAHELGHAILHEDCVNHFATTTTNASTNVEYEANLFAVALLGDNDLFDNLSIPLENMNNYLLKTILDTNIVRK